jgi:hypothetical protein
MPASHSEHRIARDPRRGTLVPNLFRSCNGDARGIVRQGDILAGLDATFASASNNRREDQATGATSVPGSVATGQKNNRSFQQYSRAIKPLRACTWSKRSAFAIGKQGSPAPRRLTVSSASPASHRW